MSYLGTVQVGSEPTGHAQSSWTAADATRCDDTFVACAYTDAYYRTRSRRLSAGIASATLSNMGFGINLPIIDLPSLFPYQAFVSWILRYTGQDN